MSSNSQQHHMPLPVPRTSTEVNYTLIFDRLPPDLAAVSIAVGGAICIAEETELPLASGTYAMANGQSVSVTTVTTKGETVTAVIFQPYDEQGLPMSQWQLRCRDGSSTGFATSSGTRERTSLNNGVGGRELTVTWRLEHGQVPMALVCPLYWDTVDAGQLTVRLK